MLWARQGSAKYRAAAAEMDLLNTFADRGATGDPPLEPFQELLTISRPLDLRTSRYDYCY